MKKPSPRTHICVSAPDRIVVHGLDLIHDLIGSKTYTETLFYSLTRRFPSPAELGLFDACMVSLMEHGFNPSSVSARLAASSNPEEIQIAIAAGILNVGPVFAGTMEECASLLIQMAHGAGDDANTALLIASQHAEAGKAVPGFGHPLHKPHDPRATALLGLLEELTFSQWAHRISALSQAVNDLAGQPVPLNVTGACAAVFLELGLAPSAMRGIAVAARCGGLLAHILEEYSTGSAKDIVRLAGQHFPYTSRTAEF